MQNQTLGMTRRSLLTKAAIGLPAMGVVGALTWANPTSTPEASASFVDGIWGSRTTAALQEYFGTPRDGIVSGQNPAIISNNTRLGSGWDFSDDGGSALIAAIQRLVGASPDGYFGPRTSMAWHAALGYSPRPYFDQNTTIVHTIQQRLARGQGLVGH